MKRYLLGTVCLCGLFLLIGCGGSSSSTSQTIQPLTITSAVPPSGTIGSAYAGVGFPLTASGGKGPYIWSWTPAAGSALPPGLTLANAMISGTPTQANTYNVVITVMDSQSPAAQASTPYAITITGTGGLTITSGDLPNGVAGWLYEQSGQLCYSHSQGRYVQCQGFPLTVTGGGWPYTWSWVGASGSATPAGLHIAGNSTQCPGFSSSTPFIGWQICGIPTTPGTYNVIVTVADSVSPQNQVSVNYTINIANPPPPSINTNPAPSAGAINLPYSFVFTTSGGLKPLTWSETGILPLGLTLAMDGTLAGTPTATGSFPVTMMVSDSLGRSATPQDFTILVAAHGFKTTGSMAIARGFHSATLLRDGRVLVAGGLISSHTVTSTSELYDAASGTFSSSGSMGTPRDCHTATLLTNGTVLIAGGYNGSTVVATAEIFDPVSGSFAPTGSMVSARSCHTATLLTNGKVVIAGGYDGSNTTLATTELFDPASGSFSSSGSMGTSRGVHAATLLQSGKVLMTGGVDSTGNAIATAELYDPATGYFSPTGSTATARSYHTATLLATGAVFVAGGIDSSSDLASAEIFDPMNGTFASTGSMATAREFHTATLLKDGTVLVAGGLYGSDLTSTELFDPTAGNLSGTGSLVTAREDHRATLLNDGAVLFTGGFSAGKSLATAELYQ